MTTKHTPEPWTFRHEFQSFDGDAATGTSNTAYTRLLVLGADGSVVHEFYDPNELGGEELDREEANARLIAAAPDHALICRAMCVGAGRWEPWGDGRGEFCMNGLRHATKLDEFGVPEMTSAMRSTIAKATQP